MSNFSGVYHLYLQGYVGSEAGIISGEGYPTTERLCQALALGVHHRTTLKPPLMSSVAVTAALRAMAPKARSQPVTFTRLLLANVALYKKLSAIKAVREFSGLGLKEAKDVCDDVCASTSRDLASVVAPWWRPDLTASARIVAAAKLLRDAGCTVEVS